MKKNIQNKTNELINNQKEFDDIKLDNKDLSQQIIRKENNLNNIQNHLDLDLENKTIFQLQIDFRNIRDGNNFEKKF